MKKFFAIAFIAATTLVACNNSGDKKAAEDTTAPAAVDTTTPPAVDTTAPAVDTAAKPATDTAAK